MKKIIMTVLISLGFVISSTVVAAPVIKDLGAAKIKKAAEEFVSKYLVDGAKVDIKVGSKVSGLYDLEIKIDGGNTFKSRISPNGEDFYPSVINIADYIKNNKAATSPKSATAVTANEVKMPKSLKPTVELFVMSYCPYGTQALKGIMPVVESLGAKIDFKMKFVSYIMHGAKESGENLRQYCINQEQVDKFMPYMKCFLASGDSMTCLTSTKVNLIALNSCISASDIKFKVTEGAASGSNYPAFNIHKDDNLKYAVQGSPTLIINGVESRAGRDSASYLAAICAAFAKAPAECQAKLSTLAPAPGFGTASTQASAAAGCAQ